jgi:SAM-dependent methyltransferase
MHRYDRLSVALVLTLAISLISAAVGQAGESPRRSADRAAELRAICQRLGVGEGATIADIGCGKGNDTFVFASVVGPQGAVFAQEINAKSLTETRDGAKKRKLSQIVPVLGQSDDPRLPNGQVDMIYMHFVFHHFSEPGAMLRTMWLDLKPGGYLTIVDRQKGPLTDWVAMAEREKHHHWTGETTVVRLARGAGFRFVDALDDLWTEKGAFVLVFQRPLGVAAPRGDVAQQTGPDHQQVIEKLSSLAQDKTVVLVALDAGRKILPALSQALPPESTLYDVVLEEWAISKDELPAGADGDQTKVLRTEKGDIDLPADADVDLVLFAGAYHRLWQPTILLERLRSAMSPDGRVVIVDRKGPDDEPRRLANHRRRIAPAQVRKELEQAGFKLVRAGVEPLAAGFFLLEFAPDPAVVRPTPETPEPVEAAAE